MSKYCYREAIDVCIETIKVHMHFIPFKSHLIIFNGISVEKPVHNQANVFGFNKLSDKKIEFTVEIFFAQPLKCSEKPFKCTSTPCPFKLKPVKCFYRNFG